ncbi:uncharacterized protein LOC105804264 isoform X5 [Gossypium raimondii]|nr:uncharacterized protein LOC105804264 isoform X5 [Gossypium raimondii]
MKEQKLESYFGCKIAINTSMSIYRFLIVVGRMGTEMLTNEAGEVTRNFLRAKHTRIKKVSGSSSCWHLSQDITSTTFYRIFSARRYILVPNYRQILGKIISMLNLVFSLQDSHSRSKKHLRNSLGSSSQNSESSDKQELDLEFRLSL